MKVRRVKDVYAIFAIVSGRIVGVQKAVRCYRGLNESMTGLTPTLENKKRDVVRSKSKGRYPFSSSSYSLPSSLEMLNGRIIKQNQDRY